MEGEAIVEGVATTLLWAGSMWNACQTLGGAVTVASAERTSKARSVKASSLVTLVIFFPLNFKHLCCFEIDVTLNLMWPSATLAHPPPKTLAEKSPWHCLSLPACVTSQENSPLYGSIISPKKRLMNPFLTLDKTYLAHYLETGKHCILPVLSNWVKTTFI